MEIGIKEAAKRMNTSPANVRLWIKSKKLKAEKKTIGTSKVPMYVIKVSELGKLKGKRKTKPEIQQSPEVVVAPRKSAGQGKTTHQRVIEWAMKHPACMEVLSLKDIQDLVDELG